jgi:hypothetical protein
LSVFVPDEIVSSCFLGVLDISAPFTIKIDFALLGFGIEGNGITGTRACYLASVQVRVHDP